MKRIERKKILAFGASNSRNSINKRLAGYTASLLNDIEMHLLDLNDFEMPIYSIDIEKETGIPETVYRFKSYIDDADGIIISFAEHNGHYTAVFKKIVKFSFCFSTPRHDTQKNEFSMIPSLSFI